MALPPIPSSYSSSATSTFSCSSHLHLLLLQSQTHSASKSRTLKFRVSCSNQTVQVDTQQPRRVKVDIEEVKKKTNPRPSFFDEIRDKWSVKLSSQRRKFPWEEPEPEEQQQQQGEEEKEECDQQSSEAQLSDPNLDVKASLVDAVSFPFRKRYSPWHQGVNPTDGQLDFENGDELVSQYKSNITGSVIEREEIFKDGRGYGRIDRELDDVDHIPDGVMGSKETASAGEEKTGFLNERATSGGGDCSNFRMLTEDNGGAGSFPSQRANGVEHREGDRKRRSNTQLAERLLPEHELRRLRNVALRMVERFNVGVAGITQELVNSIHDKWREDEVVKLKFEGPLAANMKRTHETLESKTGGLVVWRSGSSVVLYRGMTYKLPCVQSYTKITHANVNTVHHSMDVGTDARIRVKEPVGTTESFISHSTKSLKDLSEEELMELSDLNNLLDELGPRFKDWSGREPLPVDADLLPAVVPGYKTPFRLLPYGVRHGLKDKEMTNFRRLSRTTPPHFALGRNRELQGLANAMVKLWERSAIAKIAIKRGVANTRNERMAEELKKLTGGTLLSRNKEYIVFYRGNDFLPPVVTHALTERQKQTLLQQDKEEQARHIAASMTISDGKYSQVPLLAGTLAETRAATSHWGHQPSSQEIETMRKDSALNKLSSFIGNLEKKLALAKAKVKKAEKALAKVQNDLEPADLPTDLETLTNEERFLFRKIGLSMKPYLLLGRRGVYSGTIENMHLHWKYRELVKIIVKGKNFAQVKHIAISLEAESGGVLVSLDKTTKGYVIIVYRGKNYFRPRALRPENLLTRRQALARSIELQRREALKHHISDLEDRIELLKSELEDMRIGKKVDSDEALYSTIDDPNFSDDEMSENEGTDMYYSSGEDEKNENELLHSV